MKLRWLLALAIAMLGPSGCGAAAIGNAEDAARAGAHFRYVARSVYEALLTESCEPDPALRRAQVLANEIAAVRAFEERTSSSPSRLHLDVARSDIEHRRTSGALGCWADSDRNFAELHVQMSRERAGVGLRELETMAPGLPGLPGAAATLSPPEGAAFRVLMRNLVETLNPLCEITTAAGNDQVTAPAREELGRLRQRLEGTPYAPHFDLAEADALYERSITVAECVDPGRSTAAEASRAVLERARRQVALIAAAARL